MPNFCVNPLSANQQCHSSEDVKTILENLVECFQYFRSAIQARRIQLIYDARVEQRHLINGEYFTVSINRITAFDGGADTKKLWYIYTKNYALAASFDNSAAVKVSSSTRPTDHVSGEISIDLYNRDVHWLSFGSTRLNEDTLLSVENRGQVLEIKNACSVNSMKVLLPLYVKSEKHRKEPYFDEQRGEHVAAMPLDDTAAQNLLLAALLGGTDYWAYHNETQQYFRFKLTNPDQNVYHGFQVVAAEVPAAIRNDLNQN